jgi:hypothetical protein
VPQNCQCSESSGTVHDSPFGACAEVGSRRMALPSARRAAVHRGTAAFHGRTPEMLRPDQMSAHQQKYYDWTAGIERRGPWQDFDGDSIYPMPVLQGRARVDAKQGICGANYVNDEQGSGRPCRAAPPLESKTPVACAWLTPARSAARLSELRNRPTGNMPTGNIDDCTRRVYSAGHDDRGAEPASPPPCRGTGGRVIVCVPPDTGPRRCPPTSSPRYPLSGRSSPERIE